MKACPQDQAAARILTDSEAYKSNIVLFTYKATHKKTEKTMNQKRKWYKIEVGVPKMKKSAESVTYVHPSGLINSYQNIQNV